MKRLGMANEFIDMIKLFFQDVESSIYFNGNMTPCFQIRRGVRHGCPLVPYLFLLVGEILNILIKQLVGRREICGVLLLGGEREKILSQYANDTILTLVGNEDNVNKAMDFLNNFLHISRLEFNWGKNTVFWYGISNFKQHWLRKHTYRWVEVEISKLLGTTFGFNFDVKNVNFSLECFRKNQVLEHYLSRMPTLWNSFMTCN